MWGAHLLSQHWAGRARGRRERLHMSDSGFDLALHKKRKKAADREGKIQNVNGSAFMYD